MGSVEECMGKPALTPCYVWEAAESGRDIRQHATSIVLFESFIVNTGGSSWDVKSSGKP